MRSAKYLNAREYAERLYLSDNRDVQDFALEFIEAFDEHEDYKIIQKELDNWNDEVAGKTCLEKIQWLGDESNTLTEIDRLICIACPEYADRDIDEIIPELLKRIRPVQEYDL